MALAAEEARVDRGVDRLRVEGAVVSFGQHRALDGLDLAVAAGEVLAVVGPSGAGKSTLLRAVAGLQPLDAGRVLLDGHDVAGVPPHRRDIGLMFQDHALFPHKDVAANVAFGLRMRGVDRRTSARRVDELLELVGLPGAGRRSVLTLSGGEQQRVALARSLAPEPRLLMLDEPLGSLDRGLRERLVGELRALFERLGLTVVAVTHDHHEAFGLADRVAVLDRGRVLQAGAPAEVWARPASARVARTLALPNVLDAEVRDEVARTSWGDVSAPGRPDGPAAVVVPARAVALGRGVGTEAAVRSVAFRGDRVEVTLAVPGRVPIVAAVGVDAAPTVGDHLDVVVLADGPVVVDA
jgi:thiamine transport system ATP-binding protein